MADQVQAGSGPGSKRVFRSLLFAGLAAAGAGLDLWTKELVFRNYYDPGSDHQSPVWLIDGVLGFQTSFNPGALFGMGPGYSSVFAAVAVVFFLLIAGWVLFADGWRDLFLTATLGLISGGILGNLHDRLGLGMQGGFPESARYSVRDWILFRLEGVPMFDPWPNFNLADSCLVVGAGLILIQAIVAGNRQSSPVAGTRAGET